jgi:hypothetical protein
VSGTEGVLEQPDSRVQIAERRGNTEQKQMNRVGIERRGGPESGEATQIATHFSAKSDEFQILMQIVKLLLGLLIQASPSAVCNKRMCMDCHRDSKWQTRSIARQIKG